MAMLAHSREIDRAGLYARSDAREARRTPEDYDRLESDPRSRNLHIELVDGKFLVQMPQKQLHQRAVSAVLRALYGLVSGDLQITTQGTVEFGENRFEPDVAIVLYKDIDDDRYLHRDEIRLAIEVAVSSLAYDRNEKALYYAEGGVPEYWIVNPVARQVEIYRTPEEGRYRDRYLLLPGESVDTLCLPGVDLAIEALLPSTPVDESQDA